MHKPLPVLLISLVLVMASSLAGCSLLESSADATPGVVEPVVVDTRVIADGVIIPGQFIHLAFLASGEVVEIAVDEGAQVNQGAVLVRLGGAESILAEKDAANLELLLARQALEDLQRFADLETRQALQSVLDARLALVAAQAAWDAFDHEGFEEDLEDARQEMIEAQEDLDEALDALAEYEDRDEDDPARIAREDDVTEARKDFNAALAEQERLEVAIEQVTLNLAAAEEQVVVAEAEYEDREGGPDADSAEGLQAQINALESSIAALDAAVDHLTITAPFAGTVVRVDVQIGELALAGRAVVTVADFSTWYVETDDLTELEVVRVQEGQEVSITPEALPEGSIAGTVDRVDQIATVFQGDVTYTVRIRLEESDLPLRWGMTATVYFEE
jgi:multidrug efflux pump subunit AcrA (membrane-fusion protein)